MEDAHFQYEEDSLGLPTLSMTANFKPRLDIHCMTDLEPLAFCTLCDVLDDGARAAMFGSHDGGWACMLCLAMGNRGKRLDLTCQDAMHPCFDSNLAGWQVAARKGPGGDGPLDCAFIDATRMSHAEDVGVAVRRMIDRLGPDGWLVVRGTSGPVKAHFEQNLGDMKVLMLERPYGFDVSISNRNPDRLADLNDRLAQMFSSLS